MLIVFVLLQQIHEINNQWMLECSDLKHEITRLQNQGGEDAMLEVETKDEEQQKPTKEGNFIFHICLDGWGSNCM